MDKKQEETTVRTVVGVAHGIGGTVLTAFGGGAVVPVIGAAQGQILDAAYKTPASQAPAAFAPAQPAAAQEGLRAMDDSTLLVAKARDMLRREDIAGAIRILDDVLSQPATLGALRRAGYSPPIVDSGVVRPR